MKLKPAVLIVDDDAAMGEVLSDILAGEGYAVRHATNGTDALTVLAENGVDLVLLDLVLPGMNGLDILKAVLAGHPAASVIMMSGYGTIPAAMEATRLGAFDWLEKPLDKARVLLSVRNAVEKSRLTTDRDMLLSRMREKHRMVGASGALREVCGLVERVAATNATVLVTGESGTGKELVARALVLNGRRATGPLVHVNCAAIPETLIESELFGHVRGAFTNAVADRSGKFQAANGGTLFLDEIADLSPHAQAKVLRAIETGEVSRLGTERYEKTDVRLIAATNRDLRKMVARGAFREDLFHRINVVEIRVPPLRERRDDILPLTRHFTEEFCGQNRIPVKKWTPAAEAALLSYSWPGNVRELRNAAEKAILLVDAEEISGPAVAAILRFPSPSAVPGEPGNRTFREAKAGFEKSFLLHALTAHEWNVYQTAEAIGMARSLLYKKMTRYGLTQES